MASNISRKSFISAAMGTIVEYYDYALFSIFLPIISPYFFPAETKYDSLVQGYMILFLAVISRPLGGMFFGHIGDVFGRRRALLISMLGIAFSTLAIGLTPVYNTFGIWSIIIILIAKVIQTFCFGGEFNGAGIYVVEHAKNHREGFIGGLLIAAAIFGSFIASLWAVFTTLDFMPDWSWRLAFLFGGGVGIIGIFYRKNLIDPPNFKPASNKNHRLLKLFTNYPRECIAGFFVGGFATMPYTTVITFINPVLMTNGYFSANHTMLIQTLLLFIAFLALLISGHLADLKSPVKVMKYSALLLTVLIYPALKLIDSGFVIYIIFAEIIIIVINEFLLGPTNALLKNLFPMQYRYRGSSISFTLGMAIIGGLTPLVESALYKQTNTFAAISIWPMITAFATYYSLAHVQSKKLHIKTT